MSDTVGFFVEDELEGGEIIVTRRCPKCQRFIKPGKVLINGLGDVRLSGWICKQHGEIKPDWGWF